MKKVTIQNIAEELNISRNTVTKAFSNQSVSRETRIAVLKKAYQLGYSKLTEDMLEEIKNSSECTKTMLVIMKCSSSDFWKEILVGIGNTLNEKNYRMQCHFVLDEEDDISVSPDVSGFIMLNVFSEGFVKKISEKKLPIIFFDSPVNPHKCFAYGDIVLVEGWNAVYRLTSELIKQGKKKIGFIGDTSYSRMIYERYQGFVGAMVDNGIELDKNIIINSHVPNQYYDYREVQNAIVNLDAIPEAFVCSNDDIARSVIMTLEEMGISVPEDVLVTGFDNNLGHNNIDKKIKTVDVRKMEVGKRIAKEILYRIDNSDMDFAIITVATYVIGGNT